MSALARGGTSTTRALVIINFIVMVACIGVASRMLMLKRLRAFPSALLCALLYGLAAFQLPSFFFLVTNFDRLSFTADVTDGQGSSGACKAQGFLLTFAGNFTSVLHYFAIASVHALCAGKKPTSKQLVLGRAGFAALLCIAWALVGLFLGKQRPFLVTCHFHGPAWMVYAQCAALIAGGFVILSKSLRVSLFLLSVIQVVPRRPPLKASGKDLVLDSVDLKHPKFVNDPARRILPPLQRHFVFASATVTAWVGVVAGSVASIITTTQDASDGTNSLGLPRSITPVEIAVTAIPALFLAVYVWMFKDLLRVQLWGAEEVWIARANDFDSKRFKNNMEVVGVVSSAPHGLPRVASGYWKPSHAYVLSPKSAGAGAGAGADASALGGGGAAAAAMSPAHKWNLEQERQLARQRPGAHSLVSDSMGRDVVLPSVQMTQFRLSGRFGDSSVAGSPKPVSTGQGVLRSRAATGGMGSPLNGVVSRQRSNRVVPFQDGSSSGLMSPSGTRRDVMAIGAPQPLPGLGEVPSLASGEPDILTPANVGVLASPAVISSRHAMHVTARGVYAHSPSRAGGKSVRLVAYHSHAGGETIPASPLARHPPVFGHVVDTAGAGAGGGSNDAGGDVADGGGGGGAARSGQRSQGKSRHSSSGPGGLHSGDEIPMRPLSASRDDRRAAADGADAAARGDMLLPFVVPDTESQNDRGSSSSERPRAVNTAPPMSLEPEGVVGSAPAESGRVVVVSNDVVPVQGEGGGSQRTGDISDMVADLFKV